MKLKDLCNLNLHGCPKQSLAPLKECLSIVSGLTKVLRVPLLAFCTNAAASNYNAFDFL